VKYKVIIVGLGSIGLGYDLDNDSLNEVRTHAKAFQTHDDFYLAAGVDCNIEKRNIFEKQYKCKSFSSIDNALSEIQPEIVVIATPTKMHFSNVKDVIKKFKPIIILCEKPMSYDLDEASEMVSLCKANNVKLYLNYIRRSDPSVKKIKKMIDTGVMSTPIKGVVWYSKGFLHNGAHFYDLLKFWFGSMVSSKIINSGRRINDSDFEPDVNVNFTDASVFFLAANEEFYSHYTIELITPQGRLRYDQGGNQTTWHQSVNSSSIVDYKFLSNIGDIIDSDMNHYQLNVVKDMSNALNGKDSVLCTADEELQTMIDLHSIIDDLKGLRQ